MKSTLTLILIVLIVPMQACRQGNDTVAPVIDDNASQAVLFGSGSESLPGDGELRRPVSKKEQVVMNCRTVQTAVEQFAAENEGVYPSDLSHRSLAGHTVTDLLPDGMLLVNPFWLCRCVPVDGAAAQSGETGYVPMVCDGMMKGYVITGYGKRSEIMFIVRECDGQLNEVIGPDYD